MNGKKSYIIREKNDKTLYMRVIKGRVRRRLVNTVFE